MQYRLGVVFLIGAIMVVSAPFVASAQSAEELRAQIAQILSQITFLRSQLQPTGGTTVPTTTQIPVIPSAPVYGTPTGVSPIVTSQNGLATFQYSRCPDLQFNLERGDRDANVAVEVTMLQRFLSQDSGLYPEGLVTGFFGPATERAVQRFQERHGIVTKGDYQSTGYGRVGPRTRHAIKNSCGIAGTHAFAVSPVAGIAPLRVNATFEFRGSSCTSYLLDWGDGSAPDVLQAPTGGTCTRDTVRKQVSHTYTSSGTYVVVLRVGQGSVYTLPIVGRSNVTVQGGFGGSGTGSQASILLSPAQGSAPLAVQATLRASTPATCTSYEIDWGDGTPVIQSDMQFAGCTNATLFNQQFSHTYLNPGVYNFRARAGRGSIASLTPIDKTISVSGSGGGTTVNTNCFVSPQSGNAPLTSVARILLGGTLCDGSLTYRIDWGDGQTSATRTCSDQNAHFEQITHTYATPGSYIARLQQSHPNARFEEQSCTVSVRTSGSTGGGVTQCTQQYQPVCGRDTTYGNQTYTNLCFLQNSGAQYLHNGACTNTSGGGSTGGGGVNTGQDSLDFRVVNSAFRRVEFTALINSARECNGGVYTIYFGDGNDSLQPYPADACQLFTRVVEHAYAEDGTYTALLLKDGVEVDRVTVTVSGSSSAVGRGLASVMSAVEAFIQAVFR